MTYTHRIVNERPANFFSLQEDFPFRDYTGTSLATVLGSPIVAPPLVVGGGNSYVFNGNDNFRFPSRVFSADPASTPFTLEAWFKNVTVTGPKGILGHTGQTKDLWFDLYGPRYPLAR